MKPDDLPWLDKTDPPTFCVEICNRGHVGVGRCVREAKLMVAGQPYCGAHGRRRLGLSAKKLKGKR